MGKTRQILMCHRDWLRATAARPGCDALCRVNFLMRAWTLDKMIHGSFKVQNFVDQIKWNVKQRGKWCQILCFCRCGMQWHTFLFLNYLYLRWKKRAFYKNLNKKVAFLKNICLNIRTKGFSYGNKTYLSTVENTPCAHTRVSWKNVDKGRTRGIKPSPRSGTQKIGRHRRKLIKFPLIWRVF